MIKNRNTPILIALTFLSATVWCATSALASITLTNIPIAPWGADVSNEGRSISLDGKYIVGLSGTANGYLYDVAADAVRQPNGGGGVPGAAVTGIAYRTDTNQVSSPTQLILDGMSAGYQMNWMTTDGGLTWGAKRRNTSFTQATVQPVANSLAANTGSDAFYTLIRNTTKLNLYTLLGVGQWDSTLVPTMTYINKGISGGDTGSMNAVAATGRAVGYRSTGGVRNNYVLDYPPSSGTAWNFNGLDGTIAGEPFSISLDGNIIFGHSPVLGGRPGRWPYKAVVTSALNSLQSIHELPSFPDTTGAGGSAGVPYACTADGKYAAGMTYRGSERAALWDTSDPDPLKWTVVDLTQLAAQSGNLDVFLFLNRAYGVATNAAGNIVITGIGPDTNSPSNTRAFVMTITPPIAPIGFPPTVTISGSYPAGFSFSFLSVTGALATTTISNFLVYSTGVTNPLSSWTIITGEQSTGGTITLSDPNPPDVQRFYRILMQ